MAAVNVHARIDQENTNAGIRGLKGGSINSGPVGKTFQSNSQRSLVAPRRALGDVNNLNRTFQKNTKSGSTLNKPTAKKGPTFQLTDKQCSSVGKQSQIVERPQTKVSQSTTSAITTVIDDIEHMYIEPDQPDTYEDILPLSDRPSTHIDDMLNWRGDLYSFHHSDYVTKPYTDFIDEFSSLTEKPMSETKTDLHSDLYISDSELNDLDLPSLDFNGSEDLFLPLL